jgi:hypothetical protein
MNSLRNATIEMKTDAERSLKQKQCEISQGIYLLNKIIE